MVRKYIAESLSLSRRQKRLLRKQTITREGPGTILRDFDALLTYVRERRLRVTGKHQLPLNSLPEINAWLTHPLQLGLTRPQQKSYPPIHGLYLLLRASGMTHLDESGSQPHLVVDEDMYREWEALNPTERYFSLLEIWLLRGWAEIVGEGDAFGFIIPENVDKWFNFYQRLPDEGLDLTEEPDMMPLHYSPSWRNLGLLYLFGLIAIRSGPPVEGEGWQIQTIRRTRWGDALLALLATEFLGSERPVSLHELEHPPAGVLQPVLEPYFPAWERTLPQPEEGGFCAGVHVFTVTVWRGVWRRLAIPGEASLDTLASAILNAFEFSHDHLYCFTYETRVGTQQCINHSFMSEGPWTSGTRVGELPLRRGQTMIFLFDFGDQWEFELELERVDLDMTLAHPEVLESRGESPEQYPRWDGGEYESWS